MKNKKINNLSITAHQINTVVGDIDGNTEKIFECLNNHKNTDIHVFPETSITGYLCGALLDRVDFIKENEEKLQSIFDFCSENNFLKNKVVIIGYISYHGIDDAGFPIIKNSVACINNGILQRYDKQLLANGDHHEDKKYFKEGEQTKVFDVNIGVSLQKNKTIKLGCPICEDNWFTDHDRNIPEEMVNLGAEIIISINQSYFYYGKQLKRYKLFSRIAKHNNVPVVTVNNIGLGDVVKNIISYDGGSMFFNEDGDLVKNLKFFEEESVEYRYAVKTVKESHDIENRNQIFFDKYFEIYKSLTFTLKEFFRLQNIQKAQVHLSGGLDSSIVGLLCAKTFEKDNCVFISNPSECNGDETKNNANFLADKLGIKLYWNPIQEIYETIKNVDEKSFMDCENEIPLTGLSSIQAVLRTVQSLAANHRFKSATVCTGNHTENSLGWYSFSDVGSTGILQIIGDLTKMECFEFAKWLNKHFGVEIIPISLYNGMLKPAAELPDANEDPIDYKLQSGICAELVRNRKTVSELMFEFDNKILSKDHFPDLNYVYSKINVEFKSEIALAIEKLKKSVYKGAQAAPVAVISPRSRGFSSRETLINKYKY